MISVKLAENENIITFDGTVVEFFIETDYGHRFHIASIHSITLEPNRRGHHTLIITHGTLRFTSQVDDSQLESANRLMAAIQQALAAFKFD